MSSQHTISHTKLIMRPSSTPVSSEISNNNRRRSIISRLSGFGSLPIQEAFSESEAKSVQATDLALRIGKKDPSLPCIDDRKYTPLHVASHYGKEEVCKMLLAQNPQIINIPAKLGLTPLIVAANNKQWKIVQLLIASGADLKAKDSSGRTAYDIAITEKAPEHILSFLSPSYKKDLHGTTSPFSSIVVGESISVSLKGDI